MSKATETKTAEVASTEIAAQETKATETKTAAPHVEKKVKLRIPLSRSESDDVFVSVNDRTWQIKRGVEVEVPECVAEVLRHRDEQLYQASVYKNSVISE